MTTEDQQRLWDLGHGLHIYETVVPLDGSMCTFRRRDHTKMLLWWPDSGIARVFSKDGEVFQGFRGCMIKPTIDELIALIREVFGPAEVPEKPTGVRRYECRTCKPRRVCTVMLGGTEPPDLSSNTNCTACLIVGESSNWQPLPDAPPEPAPQTDAEKLAEKFPELAKVCEGLGVVIFRSENGWRFSADSSQPSVSWEGNTLGVWRRGKWQFRAPIATPDYVLGFLDNHFRPNK